MAKVNQKKDSRKNYTKEEILAIKAEIDKNGSFTTYEHVNQYAKKHFELKGENNGKSKSKKDSGKNYTKEEILAIKAEIDKNGSFTTYEHVNQYAKKHFELTGKERSGHALYMCAWRIEQGRYNHYLK